MIAGDVITAMNNQPIRSVSELQEWVARNRPGKEIKVRYFRNGESHEIKATLKDNQGREDVVKREILTEFNGLIIDEASYDELLKARLESGVKVKKVGEGKWKIAGLKPGFIIGFIDRVPVDNVEDFNRMLEYKHGGILVEGFYLNGDKGVYGVEW